MELVNSLEAEPLAQHHQTCPTLGQPIILVWHTLAHNGPTGLTSRPHRLDQCEIKQTWTLSSKNRFWQVFNESY
jgi:hypothetical protein